MPNDAIDIYWAPYSSFGPDLTSACIPIETLYDIASRNRVDGAKPNENFFNCPATADLFKHTLVVKNILNTKVRVQNGQVSPVDESEQQIKVEILRPPIIKDRIMLCYNHYVILYSSEPLTATLTPSTFERTVSSQYGVPMSGRYDIGRWFRPMGAEFMLWPNVDMLHVPAHDSLFYVSLNTPKPIQLKQFYVTPALKDTAMGLVHNFSPDNPLKEFASLSSRYERFESMELNSHILQEIRSNLVGDK